MNGSTAPHSSLTRRDILKAGAVIAIAGPQLRGEPAEAQTPKRGGTLRFTFQSDPVTGFDPQQTISPSRGRSRTRRPTSSSCARASAGIPSRR